MNGPPASRPQGVSHAATLPTARGPRLASIQPGKRHAGPSRGDWLRLTIAVSLIAGIWLVWLPRLAREPSRASWLEGLDRQGIDASAMFYTELPMMTELLERLER